MSTPLERIAELQRELAKLEAEKDAAPVDDNPSPSPLHAWNGSEWVLPAQHEIAMLQDMGEESEVPAAEERLSEQLAQVEQLEVEA